MWNQRPFFGRFYLFFTIFRVVVILKMAFLQFFSITGTLNIWWLNTERPMKLNQIKTMYDSFLPPLGVA